jgi:DNA polymerase-3 subunit alpha
LVKAGAFDSINNNRQSLFDSIPNFILKTKNIFENKSANQIDLFSEDEVSENNIINEIEIGSLKNVYLKNLRQLVFLFQTIL